MRATVTPAAPVNQLPVIVWRQVRVITTELLAREYETDEKNIQQNYSRNADRFLEGTHFYKLEGGALSRLKKELTLPKKVSSNDCPEMVGVVPKHARSLILWTERGAARHAKMLDTDAAWDVFERLEDFYFRVAQSMESPAERARLRHETVGIHKAMNSMLVARREKDGKECAPYHFMNEAKLINHVLIGKFKGVDRDALSLDRLALLAKLEARNTILIADGVSYQDRKIALEQFAQDLASTVSQIAVDGGAQV